MASSPEKTRYLLAWLSPMAPIDVHNLMVARRQIEDAVNLPREQVEIDLWLESPGGNANAAYKLALMLRHAASHIRVVVPDYAKSAATLLALVGDEIYLAPGAELGPLDAQMPEEGSLSGFVSALNIARAADEVARDAVALAGTGGADLLMRTGLSRANTLDAMLRFSASFSEPLVRQLDPKLVHQAKEMLRVTAQYAERLLTKTVGSPVAADEIAKQLVETFPTHGFVISYEEAQQLGLPAKPIVEYDLREPVRLLHRIAEDGQPVIHFGLMDDFLETDESDDDTSDEEESDDEQGGDEQHETEEDGRVPGTSGTSNGGEVSAGIT
jgi:hypothetical protein